MLQETIGSVTASATSYTTSSVMYAVFKATAFSNSSTEITSITFDADDGGYGTDSNLEIYKINL